MEKIELSTLAPVHRTLLISFLLSLATAYAVALLFVFVQTDMHPTGIQAQYRGSSQMAIQAESGSEAMANQEIEDDSGPTLRHEWKTKNQGMKFPKSLKDLILTTHLHLLSISIVLFLLGGIFSFSSLSSKAKAPCIAIGFLSLIFTYACMWGLRYVHPLFSYGVFVFGLLQALSIGVQFLVSLFDLVFRPRKSAQ